MKTKLITLFMLLSVSMYSQFKENRAIYVATGVDIQNAVFGSDPTGDKPAYDGIFKAGIGNRHWDMAITYEIFQKIGYQSLSFQPSYVLLNDNRNRISAGIEVNLIERKNIQEASYYGEPAFIGTGLNLDYRRKINELFDLGVHANLKTRPDIREIYNHDDIQYRPSLYFVVYFNIFRPD